MRFSNLHQHTDFSDGKNTPEEIVIAAIEKGFESIGFSDHSYTKIDESYCMMPCDYQPYFDEVNRLKEKYKDKIKVFLGIEEDYFSTLDREKYDYIISSVHYMYEHGVCHPIDHSPAQQKTYVETECHGNINEFAKNYYDLVIKNVEENKPDIVGHFDVISKFGLINEDDPEYRKTALSALDRVMKTCKVIEMNTGAISRKVKDTPYPNKFILKRVLENGGDVILSADSHAKDTIDTFFVECLDILREVGFDHIVKFTENGFVRENI